MCGIVGYLGPQAPEKVILEGLKKLEYRGYDSAGVSILDHGRLKRIRASGKLSELQKKLQNESFHGNIGIGHTRWATHGVPHERNAHPHQVEDVSVVHNGIIENYQELRAELQGRGAVLTSETDSELVAHLLAEEVKTRRDLLAAVLGILPRLKGAFSIVCMWEGDPDHLVAFKEGPPLIVALGEQENFVVSDIQAALAYTHRFVHLSDREVVRLSRKQVDFFDSNGKSLQKSPVEIHWSQADVDKMGFSHFMLKEIHEIPRVIAQILSENLGERTEEFLTKDFGSIPVKSIQRIVFVACGTSYYAGLFGQYLIESRLRIPCSVEMASEFRYRQPALRAGDLVFVISQSGETADTLAALRMARNMKIPVVSLCNVQHSSIDRESDLGLAMRCGPEIGVASTKAFVASLIMLQVFAAQLARARDQLDQSSERDWVRALRSLPSQVEVVLNYHTYFESCVQDLVRFKGFLYMGRGYSYPIALEGALKMKELAYLHAEGYAAGEMKHGPLALIDNQMAVLMLAPRDEWFDKTLSNLEEARARGAFIISIGSQDDESLQRVSDQFLPIPKASSWTSPVLSVIPLQLMAFSVAKTLGHDVDQPRNLAKSVTVE
jgi:glucosamine--fructose-6-phosphate aminotransferase (isomerizing)